MNTKTICKELNISPKALRIYEEYEIVVPLRGENNYRNYSEENILKLRQVILLKEMGISLKDIKILLDKEIDDEYKLIRGLNLQLKAVVNKISELENIKNTLHQSINEALELPQTSKQSIYFNRISECLKFNRENRTRWMDKWSFDTWATNYDESIQNIDEDGLNLFEKYDYVIDSVVNKISESKAKKVLDIGCGTGNLYERLNSELEFVGIDQSAEMLIQAKNKHPELNLRIGNFLDTPFAKDEFDILVSTYAFHHLNALEKETALNLMLSYLKPGGRIIIADIMFLNEFERNKQKEHYYSINRQDLWEIVEDEYYTDLEKLQNYGELLGCKVTYKHLVNFTWLLEIEKSMENK